MSLDIKSIEFLGNYMKNYMQNFVKIRNLYLVNCEFYTNIHVINIICYRKNTIKILFNVTFYNSF